MTFSGFVDFGNRNVDVTHTATLNESAKEVSGGCVVFAGGGFGGDGVALNLVERPKGTKLYVNADGNLEISVSAGTMMLFR
jgi:hypothetical protein